MFIWRFLYFRLLNMDFTTSDMGARSSSESSMVSSTFGDSTTADFNEDTEYLIRNEQKPAVRYNYTRQIFS
jgi:Rho-related BTB domain-containing protein 1/2